MRTSPPTSRPAPVPVTGLFPDAVAVIGESRSKRTGKAKPAAERRALNIWPHVVLYLDPPGAESPLRDADWARLEGQARERLAELELHAAFLREWLAAEKTGRVELRV